MRPAVARNSPPPARDQTQPSSQAEQVFDGLIAELLTGRYPVGSRLPPERELAAQLGTSRPTLREALRGVEALGLLRARRGSGLEVLDMLRHGTIGLLPAWLRAGAPGVEPQVVVREMLRLRRLMLLEVVRMCAGVATDGSLAKARARLEEAWALKDNRSAFVRADFEFLHALTSASRLPPAAWLLNAFERIYLELADTIAPGAETPADYHRVFVGVLDAICAKDADGAARKVNAYFERHDSRILGVMGEPQ